MLRFLMGSNYFFSCFEDFTSKDVDEIELVDTKDFQYMRWITGQGRCLFQFRKLPHVDDYINYALQSKDGLVIGKFLIPEFCKAIGFTIKDLPRLSPLIEKLDNKHKYEKIIYDSYISNNNFHLTDEQLASAYELYKQSRGN